MEKVHIMRNHLRTAYSRQKSYADHRWKELEFEECDKMYLKNFPMKGMVRFWNKGNLIPRYVGTYEILQKICKVSYEKRLPSKLSLFHMVLYVSRLQMCIGDSEYILPNKGVGIQKNLSYEEVQVQIFDRQLKRLRSKAVASVKVLRKNHLV